MGVKMEPNYLIDDYLEHLDSIQEVVPLAAVGLGISAVSILQTGFRLYQDYFTKAARQCKHLPDKEKAICMLKAKMTAKNAQLQKLKQGMSQCQKAKDPQKCKEKVSGRMMKISNQIKFFADRYKELRKQTYQKQ
jgi:hypothetical protein